MPENTRQNPRNSLYLDTWMLMANALHRGKRAVYRWSYQIKNGSIVLCKANKKSAKGGSLKLSMNWRGQNSPTGVVAVTHASWQTLPRVVLLAGIPNKDGGWLWRFLCPITRKLVQVVYFDERSQLLVSRAALGRKQRRSDFRRIERAISGILTLQHKHRDLSEKPAGMSDLAYGILKEAEQSLNHDFRLAASGVPVPIFNDDGWYDVVAMSKKPVRKTSVEGGVYYRDKSGTLKMNARSKKRLGIS